MPRLVKASEPTASRRRVYFQIVAADGISPALGEAGGQPQASANGGAWSSAPLGTLTHVGHGRYYADLTVAAVAAVGDELETRYQSASTAECPGDSVLVVAYDPYAGGALLVSGAAVVVAPVSPSTGEVTLIRGDDYLAADGRELSWAAPASGWPSLAGAAVTLTLDGLSPVAALSVGPPVTFELTRAETAALPAGSTIYAVRATLADASVVTLARGHVKVLT